MKKGVTAATMQVPARVRDARMINLRLGLNGILDLGEETKEGFRAFRL